MAGIRVFSWLKKSLFLTDKYYFMVLMSIQKKLRQKIQDAGKMRPNQNEA